MKILLDTHVWLWSLGHPNRLGAKAVSAIQDEGNELWLSPISLWELSTLVSKDRIELDLPLAEWFEWAAQELPCKEAPLTREAVLAGLVVEMQHNDPADRLLAASARAFDLTLLTADGHLLAGTGYRTLRAD